jgi:hypothetical protein
MRVDPRFAYPDVRNGKIQDLLVVETMNKRLAWRQFGDLLPEEPPTTVGEIVEIIHYYSPEECLQAVSWEPLSGTPGGKQTVGARDARIISRWEPRDVKGNPYMPVAFSMLDSFDGQFRGMFDQIVGSLKTKDRIVKQMVDYTDRFVYASMKSKGLLNPTEVDHVESVNWGDQSLAKGIDDTGKVISGWIGNASTFCDWSRIRASEEARRAGDRQGQRDHRRAELQARRRSGGAGRHVTGGRGPRRQRVVGARHAVRPWHARTSRVA